MGDKSFWSYFKVSYCTENISTLKISDGSIFGHFSRPKVFASDEVTRGSDVQHPCWRTQICFFKYACIKDRTDNNSFSYLNFISTIRRWLRFSTKRELLLASDYPKQVRKQPYLSLSQVGYFKLVLGLEDYFCKLFAWF